MVKMGSRSTKLWESLPIESWIEPRGNQSWWKIMGPIMMQKTSCWGHHGIHSHGHGILVDLAAMARFNVRFTQCHSRHPQGHEVYEFGDTPMGWWKTMTPSDRNEHALLMLPKVLRRTWRSEQARMAMLPVLSAKYTHDHMIRFFLALRHHLYIVSLS